MSIKGAFSPVLQMVAEAGGQLEVSRIVWVRHTVSRGLAVIVGGESDSSFTANVNAFAVKVPEQAEVTIKRYALPLSATVTLGIV